MKKALFLFLVIAFVSCTEELNPYINDEMARNEGPIVIKAISENGSYTRTTRDDDKGSVWWSPGDAISVFGLSNNKFVSNATENSPVVTFSGSIHGPYSNEVIDFSSVGEIVDASGIGIVAWISDDGEIALLMSVSEIQNKPWSESNSWCSSYGEGWRMPTIDELTFIHSNYAAVNASLNSSGFTKLSTEDNCYWSSTVNPSNSDYYYRERLYDGTVFKSLSGGEKATAKVNYTRAVKIVSLHQIENPQLWGLYPYDENSRFNGSSVTLTLPAKQAAVPGTFDSGLYPSIGRSTDFTMNFYHICGGIRFCVTKEGIRRAFLKGNNAEKIAGKIRVGFSSAGKPEVTEVIDGADEIVLEAPGDGTFEVGQYYYFVIIPTTFTNGFSIAFETQTESGVYKRSTKTEIQRCVFAGLKDVDKNVFDRTPKYSIGDILDSSGLGMVVWVSRDYNSIMLMSLQELREKNWPTSYSWCRNYGAGWKMPAIEELTLIHERFTQINEYLRATYNTRLTSANRCYWSSTMNPASFNHYYRERLYDGLVYTSTGDDEEISSEWNYTRAVKRLDVEDPDITMIEAHHTFVPKQPESVEAVDLGLSVKWASLNVGASTMTDYGDFFAWGELEPYYEDGFARNYFTEWRAGKESGYNWTSYKWFTGTSNQVSVWDSSKLSKYNAFPYEPGDGKRILDSDDDTATMNWGTSWRMPTSDEFEELYNNCTCEFTTVDGRGGYKLTSQKAGYKDSWIFLPSEGYRSETAIETSDSGYYWSSSIQWLTPNNALVTNFTKGDSEALIRSGFFPRCFGCSVRPVCHK